MLKKYLSRVAFSRQRAFFSPLGIEGWDWSQGATYQLFDIRGGLRASADPVGTLGLWHAPCGSYLISLQGLALQPLQREKRKKKFLKKWGKEGRCVELGGRRSNGTGKPGWTAGQSPDYTLASCAGYGRRKSQKKFLLLSPHIHRRKKFLPIQVQRRQNVCVGETMLPFTYS